MHSTILVADDDPLVRSMLRCALECAGYIVHEAENGREAIRILGETPIELLVTDILMPDCDGIEIILHLRHTHPEMKIIAISGQGNELFMEDARGLGATRVLAKPFRPHELLELVNELLAPAATSATSTSGPPS